MDRTVNWRITGISSNVRLSDDSSSYGSLPVHTTVYVNLYRQQNACADGDRSGWVSFSPGAKTVNVTWSC